ncbi:uncharacterized protein LOC109542012, partial [Dendroctonus ponderosae]|uniref:uncharacterized protein LOC109542012 n=1 Tax=Dendroctonus ponderosae TaxID=77166 RepID=UPI00203579ED
MLGVFKRRWKPKRTSGSARIASESSQEPDRPRSTHQVHPVLDARHLVGYEKDGDTPPPPPPRCLPLAPNICVEAGRIQFVRQEAEAPPARVTRGLQTDEQEDLARVQTYLEGRIVELELALEAAQKGELRDRQTISKLSKQLSRRDSAQRDADRERRLRIDSDSRARQAAQEAACCRSRLKLLTQEFARMEETVRAMLAFKKQAEQLRQEKAALTVAFENRCQQYQSTISRLNLEITGLRQRLEEAGRGAPTEGVLQAHAAALRSTRQYERCLDDVANQVVKALLAQKGLREEVGCLNGRIEELEAQNRALTSMLMHQLREEPPDQESGPAAQLCTSLNSDVEDNCDKLVLAGDARFSLADKKRHQMLTQLWTELRGGDVTPKRLLEALGAVDSALWVPPARPMSLNLQLAGRLRRARPVLAQSSSRSEDESPESGNRDEGYSTMSSDVQADMTRTSNDATLPHRSLEDLKEASDETDLSTDLSARPDVLYIPLDLLSLKQRNSFPPCRDMLPFQSVMRSLSDSHLCLKITAAPTPSCAWASPLSSSPSIFLLDLTEKRLNPLRRARASSALWGTPEERLECTAWDAEYIQQWLRLDDAPKDVLELEYDRAELEDWSLSLSSDELREHWRRLDAPTPGQISVATLPSIQENNALELEEDANECLWNDSSYMMDKEGRELVTLLMDGAHGAHQQWPYAANGAPSPAHSWSSRESLSKRS